MFCCLCIMLLRNGSRFSFVFFFQAEDGIRDVAVTGVQTCALPIYTTSEGKRERFCKELLNQPGAARSQRRAHGQFFLAGGRACQQQSGHIGAGNEKQDRKSTRLNSSHGYISYAVFCFEKKKKYHNIT